MGLVNADKYGKARPKVTIEEDMEGADVAVFTVASFDEQKFTDPQEGEQITPFLTFEETGDKVHWLNKSQVQYLIDRWGADSDKWVGEPVPLEVVNKPFGGKDFKKLWIAPPERWESIFKEAEVTDYTRPAGARGKVTKVTVKGKKATKGKAKARR